MTAKQLKANSKGLMCTPEKTRTSDLNIRNVALYPTELRVHSTVYFTPSEGMRQLSRNYEAVRSSGKFLSSQSPAFSIKVGSTYSRYGRKGRRTFFT